MAPDPRRFIVRKRPEAAYLALYRSGELARRVEEAIASLATCRACPRDCGTDRLTAVAAEARSDAGGAPPTKRTVPSHIPPGTACFTGRHARVASSYPHFGEEDCLRGHAGSGTIFFSFCNLRCVFCQNWDISQLGGGVELSAGQLAGRMLELQDRGCHNINLVTPEHVVPQVLEGVLIAASKGLELPLVYNTSGYDSAHSLALLDGVVDIYMPDFKYWSPERSKRTLKAVDYPEVARRVVREMNRQVGPLVLDESGLAVRGLVVRHLVMPGELADSREIFRFLADEVSPDTFVNVMGQYYPAGGVRPDKQPELMRKPAGTEISAARQAALDAGLWRLAS